MILIRVCVLGKDRLTVIREAAVTAAFQHALRRSRAKQGLCPSCGGPIEQGYGLMGGGIGVYEYCGSTSCVEPYFNKWPDHEMEGPAPEAPAMLPGPDPL